MGCDIHVAVERRVDGVWRYMPDKLHRCNFCEGTGLRVGEADHPEDDGTPGKCFWCAIPSETEEAHGCKPGLRFTRWMQRNYLVFAILGDVRNYWQVPSIAPSRGWPADCDPRTRNLPCNRQPDRYQPDETDWSVVGDMWLDECDLHSVSYCTLREVLDYDWDRMQAWEYTPPGWWVQRRLREMGDKAFAIQGGKMRELAPATPYEQTLRGAMPDWWNRMLLRLLRLGNPEDVRLVFAFDN